MSEKVENLSANVQKGTTEEESEATSKKEHNNPTYDDYLLFLQTYCIDDSAVNKNDYNIEYFKINTNGIGVCLFDVYGVGMHRESASLAVTKDNGKNWEITKEDFLTSAGEHRFAFINNTLIIFTFEGPTMSTGIESFSIQGEALKHVPFGKIIPGLKVIEKQNIIDLCANVLSQTDDSMIVAWTFKEGYHSYSFLGSIEDNHSTAYIAEYDSNMKVIQQIYENPEVIKHIIENNKANFSS